MNIPSADLLEEFYNENKERYPELSPEQFKDICYGPWRFLKREMESGELPTIRFKYFGVFQVYKGTAKAMLPTIDHRVKIGSISKEKHKQLKTMIIKYLNKM